MDFLTQYSEEGVNFLSHVVTGNETWVWQEAPKSKQQFTEWRHASSPTKMKFKETTSTQKIMCTAFWAEKAYCLWTSCLKVHNQCRCLLQHTKFATLDPE